MGQLKTSTGHADNVCKRSRTWGACALTFSKTWQDMAHYTHWRHRNKSVKLLLRPHLTALAEEAVASPGIAAMSKLLERQASVKRPKEDYYRRQIDVIDFIWFLCFFERFEREKHWSNTASIAVVLFCPEFLLYAFGSSWLGQPRLALKAAGRVRKAQWCPTLDSVTLELPPVVDQKPVHYCPRQCHHDTWLFEVWEIWSEISKVSAIQLG